MPQMQPNMSTDREAFVQEIVSHPEDDAPRLVFADWLEEAGDPEAEFIRAQVELAAGRGGERAAELDERQRRLFRQHEREWLERVGTGLRWYRVNRGIFEEVLVESESVLTGSLLRREPILSLGTRLRTAEEVHTFAAIPQITQLRKLRLGHSNLSGGRLAVILQTGRLSELRELWLTDCQLKAADVAALHLTPLPHLECLAVSGNFLDEETVHSLAAVGKPPPVYRNQPQRPTHLIAAPPAGSAPPLSMHDIMRLARAAQNQQPPKSGDPSQTPRPPAPTSTAPRGQRPKSADSSQTPAGLTVAEILRRARQLPPQ
jgi:uncharacterized protein (TIGR02996 family)